MVHVTANSVTVSGLTLSHSLDKGIEVYEASGFTVSGNTVHHSTSTGIHVLRSSGTVSGNRVYRSRSNGVDLHGALDTVVEGNRVYLNGAPRFPGGNEGNGILVYASQRVRVLSNTVWNNSQGQPGSRDGIRLADNGAVDGEVPTRYVTVSGNTIYDNQASGTQNYGIRIGTPYADRSTINHITVKNNTGWGNLRAGVLVSRMVPGATYVSSGNSLKGR
jgi:parallel beta-helix repeat protein